MKKSFRSAGVGLIVLVSLGACQSPEVVPVEPSPIAMVVLPTAGPTARPATSRPTAIPVGRKENAGLMVGFEDHGNRFSLELVDVTNGGMIPGHEPIELDAFATHAYFPGYERVALVIYETFDRPDAITLSVEMAPISSTEDGEAMTS